MTGLAVPLAHASDSLARPGAASAALRTPVATLGDDGKDMKETKEVKKEGPVGERICVAWQFLCWPYGCDHGLLAR